MTEGAEWRGFDLKKKSDSGQMRVHAQYSLSAPEFCRNIGFFQDVLNKFFFYLSVVTYLVNTTSDIE